MLERKRLAKHYTAVPGEDDDVELGEGVGVQESGTVTRTVEEELDGWDENAEDAWDEEEHGSVGGKTPSASDVEEAPKIKGTV